MERRPQFNLITQFLYKLLLCGKWILPDTTCVIFKGINVSKLTLAISDISKNVKRPIASQLQSLLSGFSQDWKTKKKYIYINHTKSLRFWFQIQSWNHMIYSLHMLERMQRRQNLYQFRENFWTVLNSKPTIQNTTRYNQHWMDKRINRKTQAGAGGY